MSWLTRQKTTRRHEGPEKISGHGAKNLIIAHAVTRTDNAYIYMHTYSAEAALLSRTG